MSLEAHEKALEIAKVALKHGAQDLMILDMREVMTITDYFVICTGRSRLHCTAIAEHIEEELSERGTYIKHHEGLKDGIWIILDYLDVVVHIFEEEARDFYDLRRLWADATEVEVPELV